MTTRAFREIEAIASQIREASPSLTKEQAIRQVSGAHPDLVAKHQEQLSRGEVERPKPKPRVATEPSPESKAAVEEIVTRARELKAKGWDHDSAISAAGREYRESLRGVEGSRRFSETDDDEAARGARDAQRIEREVLADAARGVPIKQALAARLARVFLGA